MENEFTKVLKNIDGTRPLIKIDVCDNFDVSLSEPIALLSEFFKSYDLSYANFLCTLY